MKNPFISSKFSVIVSAVFVLTVLVALVITIVAFVATQTPHGKAIITGVLFGLAVLRVLKYMFGDEK